MRPAILALSRWQIAAADTQAGQFALVRPGSPVRISWHFRAVSVTGGVLSGRHFALAAQFCEAGGNRGKIIGSAGSAHVSSGMLCRSSAGGRLIRKAGAMHASGRAIKQAEIAFVIEFAAA